MDLQLEGASDEMVQAALSDWKSFQFSDKEHALLTWVQKMTDHPASCSKDDIDHLKQIGFSDAALHDASQVTSYFNYINRIADSLGVDLEPEMIEKSLKNNS